MGFDTHNILVQDDVVLVRGLPGSGKSSFVSLLDGGGAGFHSVSADDFFMDHGVYRFNPSRLADAHNNCQFRVIDILNNGQHTYNKVVVHNTFSTRWELEPYLKIAENFKARLSVIDLFDAGLSDEELAARNTHGVPVQTINQMRRRWEHDWRNGNPMPPWLRKFQVNK